MYDPADPAFPIILVHDVLKQKHLWAQPLFPDCVVGGTDVPPRVHPVIFDGLQGPLVCAAALRTFGAPGPLDVDARGWRRLCTSFRSASDDLCEAMALFARRLCCIYPPNILSCRLIALDKYPGMCPIGLCEVVHRIIAKAVLSILWSDIQEGAGT